MTPAYPLTLDQFANNTALILPPEADQHRNEISPLAASGRFTLKWRRILGALTPHACSSEHEWGYCLNLSCWLANMSAVWKYSTLETPQSKTAKCNVCKAVTQRGGSSLTTYNTNNAIKHLNGNPDVRCGKTAFFCGKRKVRLFLQAPGLC